MSHCAGEYLKFVFFRQGTCAPACDGLTSPLSKRRDVDADEPTADWTVYGTRGSTDSRSLVLPGSERVCLPVLLQTSRLKRASLALAYCPQ